MTALTDVVGVNFYPSTLAIQVVTETRSTSGAVLQSWASVSGWGNLTGRLVPITGNERQLPNRLIGIATHTLYTPNALTGITTKHRAIVDSVTYDILEANIDPHFVQIGWTSTRLTLKAVT